MRIRLPSSRPAWPIAPPRGPSPAQIIALSFALAIVAGASLLSLPAALQPGQSLRPLDALFLATSAVSVTGLAVLDIGTTFSTLGQLVLLALVQLGGLGVVTASTFVALAAGRRLGLQDRLRIAESIGGSAGSAAGLVRLVLGLTLGIELLGFLALWAAWAPSEGARAPFLALFHAVSAFNNAGFSLYPDGLVRHAADPATNLIVGALVIAGGLGFLVIGNLLEHRRTRGRERLTLTTRIVLLSTGVLLAGGTLVYGLLEWANPRTLGALEPAARPLAAFFMALTPRTAGFNTVDYAEVTPASTLITLILMFIGASPSSTGGGIKTVTFFVLAATALTAVLRSDEPHAFGRRISMAAVMRALAIVFLASQIVGVAFTTLAVTEPGVDPVRLVFEAVSAFATVGLSMNLTPELSDAGRAVVMALMYVGRVGLFTFMLAVAAQRAPERVRYPEGEIAIG